MKINKTSLEGVVELVPEIFNDHRGYFFEQFRADWFKENVDNVEFVQINRSYSHEKVLRGLHYQVGEHAQGKLITCLKGRIYDVALDIREGSKTYGKWTFSYLSGADMKSFYIPRGFAHGFLVLSPEAQVQYMCDNYYCKEAERSIFFDSRKFNIKWPIPEQEIILSNKDRTMDNYERYYSSGW